MIEQNDLVTQAIVLFAYENVTRMSVTVNVPVLKDHCCEYVDEVFPDSLGTDIKFFKTRFVVYLDPFHKLHDNNPLGAELLVIVGDVDELVVFEEGVGLLGLFDL